MIEFCTVKRMIVFGVLLVAVSVIVVVVESALTDDEDDKQTSQSAHSSEKDDCWRSENYSVKGDCRECASFELVSGYRPVCLKTGFKELVRCFKSGAEVYRSCPRPSWIEKRNFWIFEAVTFVIGLSSWTAVHFRHRHLDRRTLERIQKQIASGI